MPEQHEKTLKFVKWRYYLGLGAYFPLILVIFDMSSGDTYYLGLGLGIRDGNMKQ